VPALAQSQFFTPLSRIRATDVLMPLTKCTYFDPKSRRANPKIICPGSHSHSELSANKG
jgi:hypothetical protein